MFHSGPARIAARRVRLVILAALVFVVATLIGVVTTSLESPAVTNLHPDLRRALRQAARAAAKYRVHIVVNSGWRSPIYQQLLFRLAVSKYGSEEKARRWVATADTSSHVSGRAVDIGPSRATAWLSRHGAEYGLCQIYRNEPWHYELRPEAINDGCPSMYADPGHDPRMHRPPAPRRGARKVLMSFKSIAAITVAAAALIHAQSLPKVRLPDEAAGIDAIVGSLISVYDQFDVVALGESHGRRVDSDLRVALIRHPDFAKKVRSIVVEFASSTEQTTLDRYVRGENVSRAQFERVWKRTSQFGDLVSQNPFYTDLFTAVREVNSKLPAAARIRIFGGDSGPGGEHSRDALAFSVLKEHVFGKRGKALVIYGSGHFYRAVPKPMLSRSGGSAGLVMRLENDYPGRTFTMIPMGGQRELPRGSVAPDYKKFDRALKTQVRPVMVSLQRLPFRDFTAEEFLGAHIWTCSSGGCRSAFEGSTLTLGQMADAALYYGNGRTDGEPGR